MFLGIGEGTGHRAPQTVFEFSYTPTPSGPDTLAIRHGGGDTLTAGDVFLADGSAVLPAPNLDLRGATVRVLWDAPNRELTVQLPEWAGPAV